MFSFTRSLLHIKDSQSRSQSHPETGRLQNPAVCMSVWPLVLSRGKSNSVTLFAYLNWVTFHFKSRYFRKDDLWKMFGQTKLLSLIPDVTSMMLAHKCVASVGWMAERGEGWPGRVGGMVLTLNLVHILPWGGEVRGNILTQPPPPPPHIQYLLPRICFRTIF